MSAPFSSGVTTSATDSTIAVILEPLAARRLLETISQSTSPDRHTDAVLELQRALSAFLLDEVLS